MERQAGINPRDVPGKTGSGAMPVVPDGVLRAESAQRHCLPGTLAEDGGIFADKAAWPKAKRKPPPGRRVGTAFSRSVTVI